MTNDHRDAFTGKVILAPLTKGGNLPYRRLLMELGATVTTSEMAVARNVVRGTKSEMALLRKAPEEQFFGVQLAARRTDLAAKAARIAEERGADFIDLNLGCPIDLFCRKGMGAALMTRAKRVGDLVAAMREAVTVPVTVKLRLGWDEAKPTFHSIAQAAVDGGAAAVTLHGRSRKQRYKRASDWDAIGELARSLDAPVIGNGDLLTWRDVDRKWKSSGCASVMIARGALIKPWIFREIAEGRDILLTPAQRLEILRRYRDLSLEHFGQDERGHARVREFLVWHLDFFNRYRPIDSSTIGADDHPLVQTRLENTPDAEGWEALLYSTELSHREELADRLLVESVTGDLDFSGEPRSAILEEPSGTSITAPDGSQKAG